LDLLFFTDQLHRLQLSEKSVAKVVRERIFSMAVHPCEDRLLVFTGDKLGYLGVFDVEEEQADKCVVMYRPHVRPISSIIVQPNDPTKVGRGQATPAARAYCTFDNGMPV